MHCHFNQKREVKILLDNGFFVEMTIKDLANNRCIISKKFKLK